MDDIYYINCSGANTVNIESTTNISISEISTLHWKHLKFKMALFEKYPHCIGYNRYEMAKSVWIKRVQGSQNALHCV